MRLRNIPGSKDKIRESDFAVSDPAALKGRWKEYFGNDAPIHVEIGMGKGRFIMDMASAHPDINYIGIEMYSSVLVRAIEKAEEKKLANEKTDNFVFIRMDARQIEEVFEKGEIDRIYLNFSDPWPKDRHAKRRLTSEVFLKKYEKILPDGALVEFKTDNTGLFEFSLEQAREAGWIVREYTYDLHNDASMNKGNIMTEYEEKFSSQGVPINKMTITPPRGI